LSTPPQEPSLVSFMRRIERSVTTAVFERLGPVGYAQVRPPHINLLDQVGSGARVTELADRLQMTPSAVSQLADHLERHGLIRRERDPRDRRAVMITPTEATERGYQLGRNTVDEIERAWQELLGSARFAELKQMLRELAEYQEGRAVAEVVVDAEADA
jgi:DNA-binding MarR family transcriptional regulator